MPTDIAGILRLLVTLAVLGGVVLLGSRIAGTAARKVPL